MRKRAAVALAVAAMAMAGCGAAEDEGATTSPPAATGDASYDVTVGEFVAALEPEKIMMIEDFVADNPEDCKAVNVKQSVVALSVSATEEPPDSPLPEFLLRICETSY
ncbi:MAG: hypothetical protein H0W09_00805 [Solirubrobacterales bacterium]|nr:hypothetical protein [Solirubrobacterales bacterium]